jgi:hypothetical protein
MTVIELIEAVAARRVCYVEAIQYLMAMPKLTKGQKNHAAYYLRQAAFINITSLARKPK